MRGTTSVLKFDVKPLDERSLNVAQVVPVIDGLSLLDLVAAHEATRGYNPAGSYGGLVPRFFRVGDLARYYLGQQEPWIDKAVAVLACDCGELGCWPLQTHVTVDDQQVMWHDFEQPHRPGWDYGGLGPFRFERGMYEAEVERMVTEVASTEDETP